MLFSFIFTRVKISIALVTLPIKKYLDVLPYDRFFLGNLRLSSEIFGNLRKSSKNVQKRFTGPWATFRESSEIFGKCLEIFGKSSKKSSL